MHILAAMPHSDDLVTTREALTILGLTYPSSITRFVKGELLTYQRKLPGKNGAYLFARSEVERLRDERAAAA